MAVGRDAWGQPRVLLPGTETVATYKRCTSFIDVLEGRSQLEAWMQRMVAQGLTERPDLLADAAAMVVAGDKGGLDRVCNAAKEHAGAHSKRETGSSLHSLTERIDRGEDPFVPVAMRADVAAYRTATADLKMVEIEIFVVNDELRVGGTFDRIIEIDGVRYMADLKTGDIRYDTKKIPMQLALYASGQRYVDGVRTPLDVDQDRGLVIHLKSGSGVVEMRWADLALGREGLALAAAVWQWRQRKVAFK